MITHPVLTVEKPDLNVLCADAYNQPALYWDPVSRDHDTTYEMSVPVIIHVRWEDLAEEFIDAEGAVAASSSIVYIQNSQVSIGGYLYLGRGGDGVVWPHQRGAVRHLPNPVSSPNRDDYCYPNPEDYTIQKVRSIGGITPAVIRQVAKIPDLRNIQEERRAYL